MNAFVKTMCGRFVRIDAVREFEIENGDTVKIRLEGEVERKVMVEEWKRAERANGWHVFAAAPGTCILHCDASADGEDVSIIRETVVGWALSSSGDLYPINFLGVHPALEYRPVIQHPDGSVQDMWGPPRPYEEWVEHARDLFRRRAEEVRTVN